jgi:NAD dependent epimerase/dehydratase family enzyme
MVTPALAGPLNAAAPNPVTQATLADMLGTVLGRPTILPLPSLAVRGLFGEMGQALLLEGQRVRPQAALDTGYTFVRPDLDDALRAQLGRHG